jgi:hypothetical protein
LTPTKPRYVQSLDKDGKISWTVTEDWREAHFFKSGRVAGRVLHGVDRIRTRINRGWIFEILKVTEEVLNTNLQERLEKGDAA